MGGRSALASRETSSARATGHLRSAAIIRSRDTHAKMHPGLATVLTALHNKAKTAAIDLCHRRHPTRYHLYPKRKCCLRTRGARHSRRIQSHFQKGKSGIDPVS